MMNLKNYAQHTIINPPQLIIPTSSVFEELFPHLKVLFFQGGLII